MGCVFFKDRHNRRIWHPDNTLLKKRGGGRGKLLKLITAFSNVIRYSVHIQKSIVYKIAMKMGK